MKSLTALKAQLKGPLHRFSGSFMRKGAEPQAQSPQDLAIVGPSNGTPPSVRCSSAEGRDPNAVTDGAPLEGSWPSSPAPSPGCAGQDLGADPALCTTVDSVAVEEQERERRRQVVEKFQKAPFEEIAAHCGARVSEPSQGRCLGDPSRAEFLGGLGTFVTQKLGFRSHQCPGAASFPQEPRGRAISHTLL